MYKLKLQNKFKPFTLAEGTSYCNSLLKKVKFGFTLAEVLIVISVIGVVAAITLPTLLKGIAERSNSEAEANAVQKITKSMDLMRADGGLDKTYASTDEFVDELSKYLKITTRCNAQISTIVGRQKRLQQVTGIRLK